MAFGHSGCGIKQGPASLFCKGPDFRPCGLRHTSSNLPLWCASGRGPTEWARLCYSKAVFTKADGTMKFAGPSHRG